MIRIQLGGSLDQLEKLLMNLVEDWDELERWAVNNNYCDARLQMAREEKDKLLTKISELRESSRV